MNEWTVVIALAALVGLAASYYKLAIQPRVEKETKLNDTLNKFIDELHNLTLEVHHLSDSVNKTEKRVDSHSEKLDDHEHRITVLEVDRK